eukprot:1386325-Pleurochrysis_carterae.AAC.2
MQKERERDAGPTRAEGARLDAEGSDEDEHGEEVDVLHAQQHSQQRPANTAQSGRRHAVGARRAASSPLCYLELCCSGTSVLTSPRSLAHD